MLKKNVMSQRKPFCLTREQIEEDIEAVSVCEEQRNKLFFCLEDKPPQVHRFAKMEEFLKGTTNLENISEILVFLNEDMEKNCKEIKDTVTQIKTKSEEALRPKETANVTND